MLTRDLEAEVPEPAWSAKVCLGPQELTGGSGARCPWPLLGALVFLGPRAVSGVAERTL